MWRAKESRLYAKLRRITVRPMLATDQSRSNNMQRSMDSTLTCRTFRREKRFWLQENLSEKPWPHTANTWILPGLPPTFLRVLFSQPFICFLLPQSRVCTSLSLLPESAFTSKHSNELLVEFCPAFLPANVADWTNAIDVKPTKLIVQPAFKVRELAFFHRMGTCHFPTASS